jgi:hypothetical protein
MMLWLQLASETYVCLARVFNRLCIDPQVLDFYKLVGNEFRLQAWEVCLLTCLYVLWYCQWLGPSRSHVCKISPSLKPGAWSWLSFEIRVHRLYEFPFFCMHIETLYWEMKYYYLLFIWVYVRVFFERACWIHTHTHTHTHTLLCVHTWPTAMSETFPFTILASSTFMHRKYKVYASAKFWAWIWVCIWVWVSIWICLGSRNISRWRVLGHGYDKDLAIIALTFHGHGRGRGHGHGHDHDHGHWN